MAFFLDVCVVLAVFFVAGVFLASLFLEDAPLRFFGGDEDDFDGFA